MSKKSARKQAKLERRLRREAKSTGHWDPSGQWIPSRRRETYKTVLVPRPDGRVSALTVPEDFTGKFLA